MRRLHYFILGIALSVATAALAGDSSKLKIGAIFALSGAQSSFGEESMNGVDLALADLAKQDPALAERITVVREDEKSSAEDAVNAVKKVLNVDNVDLVFGTVASTNTLAMIKWAEEAGKPLVTPASTNPEVTKRSPLVFRTCFIDPFQGSVLAKFATQNLSKRRAAILLDHKSDYSIGLAQFFEEGFKAAGGVIVAREAYEPGKKDFKTQLTKIRTHRPDVLLVPGYYQDVGLVMKQANQMGFNITILGGDGWDSPVLFELAGQRAATGHYFSTHFAPDDSDPLVQKFVADYKARFGKVPGAMASLGYDGIMIIADAFKRGGSSTPAALQGALASLVDFKGVSGKTTINAQHDAVKDIVILKTTGTTASFETKIGISGDQAGAAPVAVASSDTGDTGSKFGEFLQFLINGVSVGSMYALIALGYTMVYGIIALINFAHGEFLMMGAFLGAALINKMQGTPLVVGLAFAMVSAGLIAVVTERIAYKPLREQPKIFVLTAAIAVSVLLQNVARLIFGASAIAFPAAFPEGSFNFDGLGIWIEYSQLIIVVLSVVLMVQLWYFVNKTKVGMAMRAVSQDIEAARLMGIDTNRIISVTFYIGASLAGAVGVLYGMQYSVDPLMGVQPGLAAFVAAVLGGIGSLPGAMIGGLLIGVIENLVAGYLSSTYQSAITFLILILVLSIKPTGLLGRKTVVKV